MNLEPARPAPPPRAALAVAGAGALSLLVSVYATVSFGDDCRELQCLGIVCFWAAIASSSVGLLPALRLLRRLAPLFERRPRLARSATVVAGLGVLLTWLVLLSFWGDW